VVSASGFVVHCRRLKGEFSDNSFRARMSHAAEAAENASADGAEHLCLAPLAPMTFI